ncbi:hypothetical protein GCM10009069_26090 [Algimonas arctica]|uniref:PepSY domain-containing protein n=1 Tax=Algimonas arctica TaxID=1479486 RepID=A0A8J3G341_9PROT|nr:PepSY-associated TM helix domain-containing protein [Algimonas arctica]GHB02088.1 hypothetical protein GCM10009069_26090 [Algimonas arctica]
MSFRKIMFWSHLVAGVAAGVFILLMSVTGVLLTYEKNMVNMARNSVNIAVRNDAQRLSFDSLADRARTLDRAGASLIVSRNPDAPVLIQQRGQDPILLNPYTGDQITDPSHKLDAFFGTVTQLHRWLAMTGESRNTGRAITGAANLVFLFIVISGLYLWLPKIWRWSFIRLNLFFRSKLPTSKARDYNWHHVFGIWALIPLFFIVISGVVISYSWAGNLVYKVVGEDVPQRGGRPGASPIDDTAATGDVKPISASLQDAYEAAVADADTRWTSTRITIPRKADDSDASIAFYYGSGVVANHSISYTFDRKASTITETKTSRDASRGSKIRRWLRFIHTGEQYGIIGQTIAGLSTLAACFLVYTGLALSFRRLILPLFRRRHIAARPKQETRKYR